MHNVKRWFPLLALVLAVGAIAVVRERRIAAIESEFAAGDLPVD